MSSSRKKFNPVISVLAWMAAGTLIACSGRVVWLMKQPVMYESRAKVIVQPPLWSDPEERSLEKGIYDPFEAVVEVIESMEMIQRTVTRIAKEHPGEVQAPVVIHARRQERSSLIEVSSTSGSEAYAKRFLDAHLLEIMSFRQSMMEAEAGRRLSGFLQIVVNQQKASEGAQKEVERLRLQVESIPAKVDLDRLPGRLKKLRDERDDRRMAGKAAEEAAEDEIRRIEAQLAEYQKAASELITATERMEMEKAAYVKLFQAAETFAGISIHFPHGAVAITQRASEAAVIPKITWAGIGLVYPGCGALLGLLIGLWWIKQQAPEPLESVPC